MDFAPSSSRQKDTGLSSSYWESLNQEGRNAFLQLRQSFHQNQKVSIKDRRLVSFSNEMKTVLSFLEADESSFQVRCILVGIAFAGPFISVNTRQLKNFLGRCKSSINGSFQQLGYVALRTKSKARSCVLSVLPILSNDPNLLRQWTVRCASEEAQFCFISKFSPANLPTITEEDICEEKHQANPVQQNCQPRAPPSKPQQPTFIGAFSQSNPSQMIRIQQKGNHHLEFELPAYTEMGFVDPKVPEMTPSYSVDFLASYEDGNEIPLSEREWSPLPQSLMTRSQSAVFPSDESYMVRAGDNDFLFD